VACSGGVHCRVVSCVAPYTWDNCSTTSFRSDSTAEHSSPYLPAWGPMEKLYTAMGGQRSYLKASTGPIRDTVDRTAKYVNYQGGRIWWTSATGASAMSSFVLERYAAFGGPTLLGYPKGALVRGLTDGGWIQLFQKGCMVDSASTATHSVHNYAWSAWVATGRETGLLGFPTAERVTLARGSTQSFQRGGLWGLTSRPMFAVWGSVLQGWVAAGGADGSYGFPTAHVVTNPDGSATGVFQGGTITV
jgi:uncharacterized protein with LGFP repeats